MLLELKAATRQVAYERIAFAPPPKEQEMQKQLIKHSWLFLGTTFACGLTWLAYLNNRQRRAKDLENSLPRLDN